jgi:hypothetical protein
MFPKLVSAAKHSWLDPQQTNDKETFFYQYAISWAKAKAAEEILSFIEEIVSESDRLLETKQGKTGKIFEVGK